MRMGCRWVLVWEILLLKDPQDRTGSVHQCQCEGPCTPWTPWAQLGAAHH